MSNPYEIADKASKLLNKKAIKRFEQAKRDCNLMDFDELNVIKTIKELYKNLDADNRKTFLSLAGMAYMNANPHGDSKPTEKWVNELLSDDDETVLWVYVNEVLRKRDYLIEAVIASPNKQKEFLRGLRYWANATKHECDRIVDKATLKAYKDAGVKFVMWNTEEDDKVCGECSPRDKEIYPIDNVPPKPHLHCRCWLTPADKEA